MIRALIRLFPILLFFIPSFAKAQDLSFKKDSIDLKPYTFVSNVLQYKVPEGEYSIRLIAPEGVEQIGSLPESKVISDASKQNYQVMRIRSDQRLFAGEWYEICLELTSAQAKYKECFKVKPTVYKKLKASLAEPIIEIYDGETTTYADVLIRNAGNSPELLTVSGDIPFPLKGEPAISFYLKPGADTTIRYPIRVVSEINKDLPNARFIVRSSDNSTLATQQFLYVRSRYQENDYRNLIVPVNITSQFQVLQGTLPTLTLGLNGKLALKNEHALAYRWFGLKRFGDQMLPQTLNSTATWTGPRHYVQVGRLQYQGLLGMNGPGVQGYINSGDYRVSSTFIYEELSQSKQFNVEISERTGTESWALDYSFLRNEPIRSYSNLIAFEKSIYPDENLRFMIRPSAAITSNLLGSRITGQLESKLTYKFDEYTLNATGIATSLAHPTYNRGENSIATELMRRVGKRTYGLNLQHTYIKAKVVQEDGFRELPEIIRGRYDAYYRVRRPLSIIQFGLGAEYQQYRGLGAVYSRPTFSWTQEITADLRVQSQIDLGFTTFIDSNVYAYRHSIQSQLISGNTQVVLKYKEGPQDYYEQILFLQGVERTGITQLRGQQSWFLRENFGRFTAFAEYTHLHISDFRRYTVGASLQFKIFRNGSLLATDQFSFGGARTVQTFLLQTNFLLPIPVPFTSMHPDLAVRLIKDRNGNGKVDGEDEAIVAEFVGLDGNWLLTDEYGTVYGRRLTQGVHDIDLSKVNIQGWTVRDAVVQSTVLTEDQEYIVLFNKSRTISGKIEVKRDRLSKWFFELDYIRVEAISSDGKVYTQLTDKEGRFGFNLPAGVYTVRYNTAVFSSKLFKVINKEEVIDLVTSESERITFKVVENKRRINIRN